MRLSTEQIQKYQEDGFLFFASYFSDREIRVLQQELLNLPDNAPGKVVENDGKTVRALHGCHAHSKIFKNLVQHPRILIPAMQILKEFVYLYQFKINMKAAFTGDIWPWHRDYTFWDKEDGLPTQDVINISIFLDEVNHFNGPIYFIVGSHKEELIDIESQTDNNCQKSTDWQANFSANLKYCLSHTDVAQLVKKRGVVAPIGARGSVLLFHGNIAHASVSNISPYHRRQIIITYSSIKNIPIAKGQPRPAFLVSRDYTPLQPENDDVLMQDSIV